MNNLANKAQLFAQEAHKGQVDDDGKPYFEAHCAQAAEIVKLLTNDEDVIASAYLHDTLENTDITYKQLADTFGVRVADLVNELTHEGTNNHYGYYFPRLHSREAIMVKLADRLSNISRMGNWSEERQRHYLRQTRFWKDGSDKPKGANQ
jgi:(p)ppGpp synthase/HD superfamily hydrolase